MSEFKDMLVYYRKLNNLTQTELAKALHLSTSTIGMYESGKRYPTREIEESIADFFNVNINTLRGKETHRDLDVLSDIVSDKKLMDAIEKIMSLDAEKKEVIYQYINFLTSN